MRIASHQHHFEHGVVEGELRLLRHDGHAPGDRRAGERRHRRRRRAARARSTAAACPPAGEAAWSCRTRSGRSGRRDRRPARRATRRARRACRHIRSETSSACSNAHTRGRPPAERREAEGLLVVAIEEVLHPPVDLQRPGNPPRRTGTPHLIAGGVEQAAEGPERRFDVESLAAPAGTDERTDTAAR